MKPEHELSVRKTRNSKTVEDLIALEPFMYGDKI